MYRKHDVKLRGIDKNNWKKIFVLMSKAYVVRPMTRVKSQNNDAKSQNDRSKSQNTKLIDWLKLQKMNDYCYFYKYFIKFWDFEIIWIKILLWKSFTGVIGIHDEGCQIPNLSQNHNFHLMLCGNYTFVISPIGKTALFDGHMNATLTAKVGKDSVVPKHFTF